MSALKYTLVIDDGPLKGRRYTVTPEGIKLGRSSQCDIAISDLLLSRSHCRFEMRGDECWCVDLASANQTLVNETPIDQKRLNAGDLVKVGQTALRVETQASDDSAAPAAAPGEAAEVVIDLGFSKNEPSTHHATKQFVRPLLWLFAGILILITGVTLITDGGKAKKKQEANKPLPIEQDKSFLLHYEKVEATTDNIFRYELTLSPGGVLAVKIDDLSGKNRHVRKEKPVDPELLAELATAIESGGFFALDKAYTGFAAKPNTLNEWSLTVAIGTKAHTCRVTNRLEPENFKAIREKLETFSKNELGIWAIQFSSEKLTELARAALAVARKKFDEREVQFGNVYEAIRSYQEAVFYLDTVNPKPDFYGEIMDGFETAEGELDKRYEDQRFRADRAINLSDWPAAARELKILCELIPDRGDSRHKEAARKLVDVESRLKKARR